MAVIKQLKDNDTNVKIYPITHVDAVLNPDGHTITQEITSMRSDLADFSEDLNNITARLNTLNPDLLKSVTYTELVELRNNSRLIPGMMYRITDYQCTTTQENTMSAGHGFDIVVTALSNNTLDEHARAMKSSSTTYYLWEKYEDNNDYGRNLTRYDDDNNIWVPQTGRMFILTDELYEPGSLSFENYVSPKGYLSADSSEYTSTRSQKYITYCSLEDIDNPYAIEVEEGKELRICCNTSPEYMPGGIRYYEVEDGGGVDEHEWYTYIGTIEISSDNYFENCKLEAWDIWYSLDNDTNRFAWADDTNNILENEYIIVDRDFNTKSYRYSEGNVTLNNHTYFAWNNSGNLRFTYDEFPEIGDDFYVRNLNSMMDEGIVDAYSPQQAIPNGRGVIYRMIDEFENDCPYDFKNIQFKIKLTDGKYDPTNGTDSWVYTFNVMINNITTDAWSESCDFSLQDYNKRENAYDDDYIYPAYSICTNNIIKRCVMFDDYEEISQVLNYNIFLNRIRCIDNNNTTYYTESYRCCNNILQEDCHNNIFNYNCHGNILNYNCYANKFDYNCYNNIFGSNCYNNTFGYSCDTNTLKNDCTGNTFGNYCSNNVFNTRCSSNVFGNNCMGNIFGDFCRSNTFGNWCGFSNYGSYSGSGNIFGNYCYSNTFGNYFQNNIFGNYCSSITAKNNNNTLCNYIRNITLHNNIQKITLNCLSAQETTQVYANIYANWIKNIVIHSGVNDKENANVITINVSRTSYNATNAKLIEYKPANSETITV